MLLEAVLLKKATSLVTKYSAWEVFKSTEYAAIKTYPNVTMK
jgi:hypothetical protein